MSTAATTRARPPRERAAWARGVLLLAALAFAIVGRSAPVCTPRTAAAPALARLQEAMGRGRFVAYQPTAIVLHDGHASRADAASIRADLAVLRPRFDSLITYGALHGAEAIPEVATALKFRALIVGIWDPFNAAEVEAALSAARGYPRLVVALALGNEVVFAHRHSAEELRQRLVALRARAPSVPLSTAEPFHVFYTGPGQALLPELDFLLANVHPVFQPWFRAAPDADAAAFVGRVVDELAGRFCGPILVKETGVPTAPAAAGFGVARQASFYRELRRAFPPSRQRAFAYFAAFDAPWRVADEQASPGTHPEEAHWGLYDERRVPKEVIRELPPLAPTAAR